MAPMPTAHPDPATPPSNGDLPPAPEQSRARGWVFTTKLVGIPVGVAALIYALGTSGLDTQGMISPWPLLGGVVLFFATAILAALRLIVSLRAGQDDMPPGRALSVHFRAMFYHLFVPLGFGMDMAKFAMMQGAWARGKVTLATLLLMDRVIGVASFALLSAVTGVMLFNDAVWLAWGGLVVGGILAVGLGGGRLAGILPDGPARQLKDLHALVMARPHQVALALAMSLVMHVMIGFAVWLAAASWAIDLGRLEAVFASSSAFLFQIVPMQVAGAGGTEAAGVVIYMMIGQSAAEAALLVAVAYGFRVVVGLAGGLVDVWATWRGRPSISTNSTP